MEFGFYMDIFYSVGQGSETWHLLLRYIARVINVTALTLILLPVHFSWFLTVAFRTFTPV
jgi:hypothetical protein